MKAHCQYCMAIVYDMCYNMMHCAVLECALELSGADKSHQRKPPNVKVLHTCMTIGWCGISVTIKNIVSVHYSASALCVSCIVTEMGD